MHKAFALVILLAGFTISSVAYAGDSAAAAGLRVSRVHAIMQAGGTAPPIVTSVQFPQYYNHSVVQPLSSNNATGGVIPEQNWNVENTDTGTSPASNSSTLISSTSTATTLGFTYSGYTINDGTNNSSFPSAVWYQSGGLCNGFLAGGSTFNQNGAPETLMVTGLNAKHIYNLIVYVTSPWWSNGGMASASVSLGGASYYIATSNTLGTWTQATSTAPGSPTIGNYVEFNNLTGAPSETVTIVGAYAGLAGFQVVDEGSTGGSVPATYALTVNNGSGTGSYTAGTAVTVTANAAASGYTFAGWTGSTSALANPAAATTTLTMPAAAAGITAAYVANTPVSYSLTVNSGSGSGSYTAGTAVTVTANAAASGYTFSGWTGSTSALANPAAATTTLTMPAAATSITSTYVANNSPPTLSPIVTSVQFPQYYNHTVVQPMSSNNATGGVIAVQNWNVENTDTGTSPASNSSTLISSTGTATTLGFTYSGYTLNDGTNNSSFPSAVVYQSGGLCNGFLAGGSTFNQNGAPATLLVTGLNATHTYNLIVYVTSPWWSNGGVASALVTLGGTSYYIATSKTLGTWTQGTSTASGSPTTANYVQFNYLTGASSETVTIAGAYAGLAGFQVVDEGTTGGSAPPTYTLTVNSGSGSGSYAAGAAVTVTANAPASGYTFAGWTGSTSAMANPAAATTTFTMPAAAAGITATYVANAPASYSLMVNGGSGSGSYTAGAVVTVTANAAASGYTFAGWTGSTNALANSSAPATTLTMPAASATIAATYVANGATDPAGSALQVTVLPASQATTVAPPGAIVNIGANFETASALSSNYLLALFLVDQYGNNVAEVQNNLNNGLTIIPSTGWLGPVSITTSMVIPQVSNGNYSIMLGLYNSSGAVQLTPGPDVTQDNQYRYLIGTIEVSSSASAPSYLAPATLDLTGYHLTFDDEFASLSISDSVVYNGANWYTDNEQCCLQTTDGSGTAMAGLSSPQDPFSLIGGGGLDIRLQKVNNLWTSGVLTSVDDSGIGFSQKYGYFEMKARFSNGLDTMPAFWLLNTAAKSGGAPAGEIDIVEYIANPGFSNYVSTTLHNWSNNTTPAMSHNIVSTPTTGFHTYGMLWTATTMTFYFDGTVTFQAPTPSIMQQPYYLLIDQGLGGGWPTNSTPPVNDMLIQYIRVYSN